MADPTFGIDTNAASTGGGTQAWTKAGIGTPNAVMMVSSAAGVTLDTAANDAEMVVGFATGLTARGSVGKSSDHGPTQRPRFYDDRL